MLGEDGEAAILGLYWAIEWRLESNHMYSVSFQSDIMERPPH